MMKALSRVIPARARGDETMPEKKTKICTKCGVPKPLSGFYYHRTRKRYMSSCKECNKRASESYQKPKRRVDSDYVLMMRATSIRRKCKLKGIEFATDLTKLLRELWAEQQGRCYYTGRMMELSGYHENDPNAFTVDRFDPIKGYIKGNVVLCVSIVNRAKQDLSYDELLSLCEELLREARR